MSTTESEIEEFMDRLEHPFKQEINQLRSLIKGLNSTIREEIKWNAPSFKLDDHFATFKLHPPKNIQIVLHRGAKPKPLEQAITLEDPNGILKWPAPDRCLITLRTHEEAAQLQDTVVELIESWISQI
ncbi:MAG: DUF1801 domain-containing protein [Pyrinomonadaceae bacterium]